MVLKFAIITQLRFHVIGDCKTYSLSPYLNYHHCLTLRNPYAKKNHHPYAHRYKPFNGKRSNS